MPAKTHTILLLIIFSSLILSCKKSDPVEPEELKPGRRDYEWTVDTMIQTPFNMVLNMWGDAKDNVWAVGNAGDFDKALWHYDGKKWSIAPNLQFIDPDCIFGLDKNNIWIGGRLGQFWKYINGNWVKTDELKVDGYPFIAVFDIWGESPNDIYAVGAAYPENGGLSIALLMHYDGKKWSLLKIPEIKGSFNSIRKDIKGSGLYFIQYFLCDQQGPDVCKIFTFDGSSLKEIYKGLDNKNEGARVYMIQQKVYLKVGHKMYNYNSDKLVLWKDLSNTNFLGRIWARNENDFFYITTDEGIGHFNGTDFKTIYNNFYPIYGGVITDDAVFFQTYDSKMRNIFLMGKLKKEIN